MASGDDARRVVETLAVHPVLPPAEALPPNDEALHALLADLARGERSSHAEVVRRVAEERVIAVEELARRAQFLVACLVLPSAGTHYEVLGVSPTATTHEIRKRWAALIQRYHPDHLGGAGEWLDDQARRLIEAYHTLKDPERRREYDRQLAVPFRSPSPHPARGRGAGEEVLRIAGRWRWAPVGIIATGLVAGLWAATRLVPLPTAPLPADPKLLDAIGQPRTDPESTRKSQRGPSTPSPLPSTGSEFPPVSTGSPLPLGGREEAAPELPSLKERVAAREPRVATESKKPEPAPSVSGEAGPSPPPAPPAASPAPVTKPGPASPGPTAASVPAPPTASTSAPPPEGRGQDRGAAVAASPPAPQVGPGPAGQVAVPAPAVSVAPTAPTPAPRPVIRTHDEALALVESFRSAYERQDLRTVMDLFAAAPVERGVSGRAEIERVYARNFATIRDVRYELSRLEVATAAGGAAVVEGRYRIRATGREGVPLDSGGRIRWVLRPEPDGLRIAALDYDATAARAPSPATRGEAQGEGSGSPLPSRGESQGEGVPAAVGAPSPPRAADRGEGSPLALIETFRRAYEREDLPAIMALLGAAPRDRGVRGRAAVEQLYGENFATLDAIRYELGQLEVGPGGADGEVVVRGRYRIRATRAGLFARTVDAEGPIRWTLRPESGGLRIVAIEYGSPGQ